MKSWFKKVADGKQPSATTKKWKQDRLKYLRKQAPFSRGEKEYRYHVITSQCNYKNLLNFVTCFTRLTSVNVFALSVSLQWNPYFSNHLEKSKLVWINGKFEKSGIQLQCLSGEGKLNLVRIIGNFEKLRVREIGILLCFVTSSGGKMWFEILYTVLKRRLD